MLWNLYIDDRAVDSPPPQVLDNRPATASVDLWALGCILYQMLAGEPPFTAPSDYLLIRQIEVRGSIGPAGGSPSHRATVHNRRDGVVMRLAWQAPAFSAHPYLPITPSPPLGAQELDFSYPPNFPPAAASLVGALIARHPSARLGAPSAGGYAALRAHPFFTGVAPPIDFATVGATPPPPLAPPPPFPAIDVDDRVLNSALAGHQLSAEERAQLLQSQVGSGWGGVRERVMGGRGGGGGHPLSAEGGARGGAGFANWGTWVREEKGGGPECGCVEWWQPCSIRRAPSRPRNLESARRSSGLPFPHPIPFPRFPPLSGGHPVGLVP